MAGEQYPLPNCSANYSVSLTDGNTNSPSPKESLHGLNYDEGEMWPAFSS